MLKFGLLLLLGNLLLKCLLGIGLWKMAMDNKSTGDGPKSSNQYNEENIEGGDPAILKEQNNNYENNEYDN